MTDLLAAHQHTKNNRAEVEASTRCGCCSCLSVFAPDEIGAWEGVEMTDFDDPESLSGGTAICPHCGNDAVLGDRSGYSITPDFLNRMNSAWYEQTIIRRAKPKA